MYNVRYASQTTLSKQEEKRTWILWACGRVCEKRSGEIEAICRAPPNAIVINGYLHRSPRRSNSKGGKREHCTLRFEVHENGVVTPVGSGHLYYTKPPVGKGFTVGKGKSAARGGGEWELEVFSSVAV
ncbi:hypothetical protein BV22DRAFT_1135616 [Leucogyrophana mollusca]|uniref:Uncharacterized protein n=1 Tax=Leucogyrophana mollusca TaxID=85980 RepID=A0ACB8AV95_9AGAM|nr:hypothetical protein BV22DRAFT_1135616 [Leucogyrophana mollusca]